MTTFQIILLITGVLIFIAGFIIPSKDSEIIPDKKTIENEIKTLVKEEMKSIKSQVDDTVNEAVDYSMEKTERALERLTNEKIMAVNEYSDTVLSEIHKNHEEVMFLYDMLNDKHTNLKNTVSKVNTTVKEVEEKVSSFNQLSYENSTKIEEIPNAKAKKSVPLEKPVKEVKPDKKTVTDADTIDNAAESLPVNKGNNNDRILELYKQGKSTVAIAKELSLGVGEVKLVIDLYKNIR